LLKRFPIKNDGVAKGRPVFLVSMTGSSHSACANFVTRTTRWRLIEKSAGASAEAAELPLHYPLVGVFGYDRQTRFSDIDGISTTMMVVETAHKNGAWTAGGFATVRGLDPDGRVYIGKSGQFSSGHRHGSNALFADGSVRFLNDSTEPKLFEAMATIAGRESVERIGDD
jgi:prepilin-type processing-associated H-X9-DG protein